MENKTLDLSALSDLEFEKVKSGFDSFINGDPKEVKYFGYLNKKGVKTLYHLVYDGRNLVIGTIIGSSMITVVGYLLWKHKKNSKKKVQKTESK